MFYALIVSALVCALFAVLSFLADISLWAHAPTVILLLMLVLIFMQKSYFQQIAETVSRYAKAHPDTYKTTEAELKFLKLNAGYLVPQAAYITSFFKQEAGSEAGVVLWGSIIWGAVSFFRGTIITVVICLAILLILHLSGTWTFFSLGDAQKDLLMMAGRWFKANHISRPTEYDVMEVESLIRRSSALLQQVTKDMSHN